VNILIRSWRVCSAHISSLGARTTRQAFLSAQRSKDPHTQVGACIVNDDKKIVGIGYNGYARTDL
jgi:deoxycytidylate deaminase